MKSFIIRSLAIVYITLCILLAYGAIRSGKPVNITVLDGYNSNCFAICDIQKGSEIVAQKYAISKAEYYDFVVYKYNICYDKRGIILAILAFVFLMLINYTLYWLLDDED